MAKRAWGRGALAFVALILAGLAGFAPPTVAQSRGESPLPRFDGQERLGVASCAGPCHARQPAAGFVEGADVRGSEILAWQDPAGPRGAHSRAYAALRSARGRDIGAKLGMADPAREPECLSCHADASAARRGPEFQITDGVSCEACHGGAGPWLASHYAEGATTAKNVAAGMFPTADLPARAKLCASCHLGAEAADQFATHRIMGAGHPRLSFELELFTSLQAHHVEDARYHADKPQAPRAKAWAIGQAVAAREALSLYLRRGQSRGAWPELAFYDCHSCHRPISDRADARAAWRPNPARGLGPGLPPFNDANLIMLYAASQVFAPSLAEPLAAETRAFQLALAVDADQARDAAGTLLATVRRAEAAFAAADYSDVRVRRALRLVAETALTERYTAYGAAEQAVMAFDSLGRSLAGERPRGAEAAIEALYAAVDDPNDYDQDRFRARLTEAVARVTPR